MRVLAVLENVPDFDPPPLDPVPSRDPDHDPPPIDPFPDRPEPAYDPEPPLEPEPAI